MRLPAEACWPALLLACAASASAEPPSVAAPVPVAAQVPVAAPVSTAATLPSAPPVSRTAIQAAVVPLRRDPNLGSEHTIRSLHWITSTTPTQPPPLWIVGLFQFLGQAGSIFLWVVGAIGLAIASVWTYRVLRARSPSVTLHPLELVSHVGEFDIRPVSLPDDVGAAAQTLLAAGRTREALSLLYRGALSRVVHRFGVRIEGSFTEIEALRAVETLLDAPRTEYFGELVRLWQRAVYAGQTAAVPTIAALCTRFSPMFGSGAV